MTNGRQPVLCGVDDQAQQPVVLLGHLRRDLCTDFRGVGHQVLPPNLVHGTERLTPRKLTAPLEAAPNVDQQVDCGAQHLCVVDHALRGVSRRGSPGLLAKQLLHSFCQLAVLERDVHSHGVFKARGNEPVVLVLLQGSQFGVNLCGSIYGGLLPTFSLLLLLGMLLVLPLDSLRLGKSVQLLSVSLVRGRLPLPLGVGRLPPGRKLLLKGQCLAQATHQGLHSVGLNLQLLSKIRVCNEAELHGELLRKVPLGWGYPPDVFLELIQEPAEPLVSLFGVAQPAHLLTRAKASAVTIQLSLQKILRELAFGLLAHQ
eukprot:RCo042539